MPSKTEEYLVLAQRTANGLTRYWESWTDYLTTASRLYKYPFSDQLMIYAQRPDAIACADYDVWNNRMNRYVRRGAKGIALLDESSGFPRLHYVFDVSDTGVRCNSRDPEVWQFMLSKRQYELVTGRRQKSDVIAYQIRQSFKPGEITAEEANKVGDINRSVLKKRAACIGTVQNEGDWAQPNKHFATQKWRLYRQKPCLLRHPRFQGHLRPQAQRYHRV